MRCATAVGRQCCYQGGASPLHRVFHQPVRRQHASTLPTSSSSKADPDADQPLSASPSSASSSSSATAALYPPGSPILVSRPSHFYLSPSEQAVRDASVARHLHQQRRLQAAYDNVDRSHLRVAFDLSYAHLTRQAASSLTTQLRVVAHHNRTADYPACLHVNSLDPRVLSAEPVTSDAGTAERKDEETEAAAANQFVRDMRRRWSDSWLMHRNTASVTASFHSSELVYLSPDAPHILWRVSPRFVYVVGGIIDKNSVISKLSLGAADALRVQSARLPITECLPRGLRKTALNIDAVFALLIHVHQAAERIRHNQHSTPPSPPSSSSSPSAGSADGRGLQTKYGLQWFPRRGGGKSARAAYKRPVFGVSKVDEGIDWYLLWCEAFDAVIPPRLRWNDEQTKQ